MGVDTGQGQGPCLAHRSEPHQLHRSTPHNMTTLEAAAEYGQLTRKGAERFLKEHDLTWEEAYADLGDSALDAVELCKWIGY